MIPPGSMPHLPPDTTGVQPLEFDWDPYDGVWLFSGAGSFKATVAWYRKHVPKSENTNPESGKLELYFTDDRSIEWSVLVADAQHRPALDDLDAYVGSM